MPVYFDRFKANHSLSDGIGGFLLSSQLRGAVRQGANDVAATANRTSPTAKVSYYAASGPDVIVTKNGNPRLSEQVRSDDVLAAAIEFGTGSGAQGKSKGKGRKERQGGGSPAYRTLGKAGAVHADRIGGSDD